MCVARGWGGGCSGWVGGGVYEEVVVLEAERVCRQSLLAFLISRLAFSGSRRCPHAADEAKRMPPAGNLTQHGVTAASAPDKH